MSTALTADGSPPRTGDGCERRAGAARGAYWRGHGAAGHRSGERRCRDVPGAARMVRCGVAVCWKNAGEQWWIDVNRVLHSNSCSAPWRESAEGPDGWQLHLHSEGGREGPRHLCGDSEICGLHHVGAHRRGCLGTGWLVGLSLRAPGAGELFQRDLSSFRGSVWSINLCFPCHFKAWFCSANLRLTMPGPSWSCFLRPLNFDSKSSKFSLHALPYVGHRWTCFSHFAFTLVCISLLRTPTFRSFRGRKAHTFWYQQTGHPDLLLRCRVHALDANTFAVSWSRVRSNHELDPSMVHNFNALKTTFWFCLVSDAADLRILFLILVTDLPPSIALGMEPGERTGAGAHNKWTKSVIWMWAYDFAACT